MESDALDFLSHLLEKQIHEKENYLARIENEYKTQQEQLEQLTHAKNIVDILRHAIWEKKYGVISNNPETA